MSATLSALLHVVVSAAVAGFLTGCSSWPLSSKWAMDDPDYAGKYSQPYDGNKLGRMLKQSIDARHVHKKSGTYIAGAGGGGKGDPATGAWSFGGSGFGADGMREQYFGLGMLHGTGARDNFFGIDTGLRFSTPSRLAPFVGAGGFMGFAYHEESANMDGIDNDSDGKIDEPNENNDEFNGIIAGYPEAGIHYWIDGTTRLSASFRFYFSEGDSVRVRRDREFWTAGFQLTMGVGEVEEPDEVLETDKLAESEESEAELREKPNRNFQATLAEVLETERASDSDVELAEEVTESKSTPSSEEVLESIQLPERLDGEPPTHD